MKKFNIRSAEKVVKDLNLNLKTKKWTLEDLRDGMNVELEHGRKYPKFNVTNDDPILTAKIALAHLTENYAYYRPLREYHGKKECKEQLICKK